MNSHFQAPAPRRNWVRRLVNLLVALVVIAVAAATFVFSYDGVRAIALLGGMSAQLARYYPGLFDAVLVIACVVAVVLRDGRWWARAWAWVVVIVLLAAIGTTDVVHAMNYSLPHQRTEGIVAAAPVVAVLLAFTLLLTVLRQSRPRAAAGDSGSRAELLPTRDLPALPAAPAATVDVPAVTADPAIRPAAPPSTATAPIALPAGPTPQMIMVTPPDGLPVMTRPATVPNETLPPAAPPVASQRAPEGEPAPPTVDSPARTPAPPPAPAVPAEPAAAEPAPAKHGIRYAGSGAPAWAADEPHAAEPAAEPGAVTELDGPDEHYWDGDDGQFAGLVYPAREGSAGHTEVASVNSIEIDEDAPPFATAPFAAVPRLNRVRSMPIPPQDEEAE